MTFCGNIFVSHDQKLRMGAFLFFRTFLLSEIFLEKMVGGCITIFPQKLLSHIAERKRTGIFECSTDFGCRKSFCIGGVSHDFFRRFFVSHYRKTSQGKPSVFQKFSGIEKIMDKKDGVVGIS